MVANQTGGRRREDSPVCSKLLVGFLDGAKMEQMEGMRACRSRMVALRIRLRARDARGEEEADAGRVSVTWNVDSG